MGEYFTGGDLRVRERFRDTAAGHGNAEVLLSLAELYIAEREVPRARRLLQQAAALGNSVAAHSLQIFDPDAARVTRDAASKAVQESAQEDDTDSMNILGLLAALRGDVEEARSWWVSLSGHLGATTASKEAPVSEQERGESARTR